MDKIIIYHNPKCSKSRQTLQLIQEKNIEPEIVEYLKTPLRFEQLKSLLILLNLNPADIVRKKEKKFSELKLKNATGENLLKAIAENPVLMERPIVIANKKAVIGRPPENVLEII